MRFKIINSEVFYLPGTSRRMIHGATLHYGLREYILYLDNLTSKLYIEEVTGGHLSRIKDDLLAYDISKFLNEKGYLDLGTWEQIRESARRGTL